MGRPLAQDPATSLHFIDDRFETLEHVAAQPDLASRWNLYFADWGWVRQRVWANCMPELLFVGREGFVMLRTVPGGVKLPHAESCDSRAGWLICVIPLLQVQHSRGA